MIGVTIVTPSYRHLYRDAAKRFRENTGLKVHAIRVADSRGFRAKLELDKLAPRDRIVFFDVDAWVIKPIDFEAFPENAWHAVNDPAVYLRGAFPRTDCEQFGIPKEFYFNSGLMVLDLRNADHRKVFKTARRLHDQGMLPPPADWTDQLWLNKALLHHRVPINHIPFRFNMYPMAVKHGGVPSFPRYAQVIHAAGFKLPEKLDALKAMELVFGGRLLPMEVEALYRYNRQTYDEL